MRSYQERREARIARLHAGAERARAESAQRSAAGNRMASVIPMGQPILVGHHSEGRDRRYRARINSNFEKAHKAHVRSVELERRADAAEENPAISSDDPEALTKLREKLAKIEDARATSRKVNAAIRKGKGEPEAVAAALTAAGVKLSPGSIALLLKPDFCGRIGIADYQLKNWSAEARRLAQRIELLERTAMLPAREEETYGAITIDEQDNRTRIHFPGKPAPEVIRELKANGFRWCRSDSCWQRMASDGAVYHARNIVKRAAGVL